MRISDWSSDVCSSDLGLAAALHAFGMQDGLDPLEAILRIDIAQHIIIAVPMRDLSGGAGHAALDHLIAVRRPAPQTPLQFLHPRRQDRKSTRLNSSH